MQRHTAQRYLARKDSAGIRAQGQKRKVQLFCLRFCYICASFVYPYESQILESFLDGHVRAFEFFGGVPRRLAYDSLKTAVNLATALLA